jgi:hypothetical protein
MNTSNGNNTYSCPYTPQCGQPNQKIVSGIQTNFSSNPTTISLPSNSFINTPAIVITPISTNNTSDVYISAISNSSFSITYTVCNPPSSVSWIAMGN